MTCMGCLVTMGGNRNEVCQKCYSCQQGVSSEVTVDTQSSLCKNCYSCQQGVSSEVTMGTKKQGGNQQQNAQGQHFVWYVFPTNACNLVCKYCYANNAPGYMTKEVVHQTLRWLFSIQPHKKINVHFFGGEPTLQWDMLVDMVKIGNAMADTNGYDVKWSMTTNGTLLNQERLTWIAENFRKSANPFLLSIDGRPETHDRNRIYHNGSGSFKDIPVELILKMFPNLECRPTITPNNVDGWFEDYQYLRNCGFKNIAIEPNHECEWTEEELKSYEKLLEKLARYYVLSVRSGSPIPMKWINIVKEGLIRSTPPIGAMCGIARNSGAIDHLGKLYACQRYASYNEPEKYALGDVWKGWNELQLLETQALKRENVVGMNDLGYNCQDCIAKQFCYKGCNASNVKHMGRRDIAVPIYCELTRREIKVGLLALAELGLLGLRGNTTPKSCSK